ncbi:hypothetical protein Q7O_000587 [Pectobacterium carotovorum subsp. carotovorum PCCS1]|nr:hypothetical protein [Pectobacterium carotovorum subsp. carotovorum PCCS1]
MIDMKKTKNETFAFYGDLKAKNVYYININITISHKVN